MKKWMEVVERGWRKKGWGNVLPQLSPYLPPRIRFQIRDRTTDRMGPGWTNRLMSSHLFNWVTAVLQIRARPGQALGLKLKTHQAMVYSLRGSFVIDYHHHQANHSVKVIFLRIVCIIAVCQNPGEIHEQEQIWQDIAAFEVFIRACQKLPFTGCLYYGEGLMLSEMSLHRQFNVIFYF